MHKYNLRRSTCETDIIISISYRRNKLHAVKTGISFLNHMLHQLSTYSGLNLKTHCAGDLMTDYHHIFEDIGIVLGKLLSRLIKDIGPFRYCHTIVPMDGSMVRCSLDLSGRYGLY